MKKKLPPDHRYFLYFESAIEELATKIRSTWLYTNFIKAYILLAVIFSINVNGAKISAIFNNQFGRTSDLTKKKLSKKIETPLLYK